jgi:hypothetical protein
MILTFRHKPKKTLYFQSYKKHLRNPNFRLGVGLKAGFNGRAEALRTSIWQVRIVTADGKI